MRKPTFELMSDLLNSLSDTDDTAMPIAVESANPTIISCAINHSNGNPVTSETAIAITGNSTTIARAIASGSTNPYLVYLSQLGAGSRRTMRESLEHIARIMSSHALHKCRISSDVIPSPSTIG